MSRFKPIAVPESRAAIKTLLTFTTPILFEFLALLAILRWRMRAR